MTHTSPRATVRYASSRQSASSCARAYSVSTDTYALGISSANRTALNSCKLSVSCTSRSRSSISRRTSRSSASAGGCTMCRASTMSSAKRACFLSTGPSLLRAGSQGVDAPGGDGSEERVRADPGGREGGQPVPRGAAAARGTGRRKGITGTLQGAPYLVYEKGCQLLMGV